MQEKIDKNGKRYVALTDEEIEALPKMTRVYQMPNGDKAIPPADCEHDFEISRGCSMDIKGCKKCIFWEWA